MAFYDENEELDVNQQTGQFSTGPQSGLIAGQSQAQGVNAPGQAGATPKSPTPDNPGNFVGLQQYIQANRPQAQRLGGQVSSQIQGSVNEAQQKVDVLGQGFRQEADKGQIANIGTASQEAKNITQQAASADLDKQINEDQTKRFGEIATAQYKGPTKLTESESYAPTTQSIQKAQQYADLSKSEAGNQQLLKDIYKAPAYSVGENRLDSYLLEAGFNRDKLAGTREQAQKLTSTLSKEEQAAADYAAQQKALADSVRQGAQSTLTQAQIDRNAAIQAALDEIAYGTDRIKGTADDATTGWQSEYNQYLNLLKNSNEGKNLDLTAEQAAKLGVGEGQRIYNLLAKSAGNTPEQYLEMQAFDPNRVISKREQKQLANLDKLASTFGGELKNPYTGEDLAGTLSKATAFAADKFGLSAKEAEKAFNAAAKITQIQNEISKGATIMDEKDILVGRQVVEKIVENLPWPLSDIVKWVTRTVYDATRIKYNVGNVDSKTKTSGSVADYLAGTAPKQESSGTKSLDWGTILSPEYLISSQADDKINELKAQAEAEGKQQWTNAILNYLKNAGYYNTIK